MKTRLRNQPATLPDDAVKAMLTRYGWYCKKGGLSGAYCNPDGKGIAHQYEEESNGQAILDHATGLMWQQGGSTDRCNHLNAKILVGRLNLEGFSGYNDWRFPTLEEAMSLMETEAKNEKLCIDPVFDRTQWRIWTSDQTSGWDGAWVVDFYYAYCHKDSFYNDDFYVRAVRSL